MSPGPNPKLARRAVLAGSLTAWLAAGPAGAAVKVVRGSSASGQGPASPPASTIERQEGVRIVRPGAAVPEATPSDVDTPGGSLPAPATGDLRERLAVAGTRRLLLTHAHTDERLDLAYWRDGAADPSAEAAIRWFLRDWRQAERSPLSVGLLDMLWGVQTALAKGGPPPALRILSAYRTRSTNDALRDAGIPGVAYDSFHLRGMAADFHCPQRPIETVSAVCARLASGGTGYYRRSGFMHVDAGPRRHWLG